MALAYGNYHELSHQLRFLLFEIGIGLPQNNIDYFITLAHKHALLRLQHAALVEGLINTPIASHHVHSFIDHLEMKLKSAKPASQFFQWKTIRDELDESIANHALSLAYKQRWDSQIRNEARPYSSLWDWINNELTTNQALLFLDQWGYQGHPYHPNFRAKSGFTRREVLQNSPEFQAKISLHWCALKKSQAVLSSEVIDFNSTVATAFPKEFKIWQDKLLFNRINPQEYYPVPVHPWQWRNKLQMVCTELTDNKSLLLFPHHQTVMPSMSCGTMMPAHHSNYHIKLTEGFHSSYKTTTMTQDGYIISQWLNAILAQSDHYDNTLSIAQDYNGLRINKDSIPGHNQKSMSVNILQNPISMINSNQKAAPLASLFAISPLSHKPLLIEIIEVSNLNPLDFFSLYCHKVLFSQVDLLLIHGVAFETKDHNALVVFADNLPQGLIMRDINEIKIAYTAFHEDHDKPNLSSDSGIKTNSIDTLRSVFINGTLQNNIANWINIISNEYKINKQNLWSIVLQILNLTLDKLSRKMPADIFNGQKHLLLHETWQHQCWFSMSLMGNNKDIYRTVPNPLNAS